MSAEILSAPLTVATLEFVGDTTFAVAAPVLTSRNDYQIGALGRQIGRIAGTVRDKATPPPNRPVAERVRLYRQRDGMLIRETRSNATTGAYAFEYIDEFERYFVIAFDKEELYRAVVADNLIPEIMQ